VRIVQAPNYQVSNPVTQANANFKMRESTDPKERGIIQLQERIASIESNVHKTKKIGQSLVYIDTRKIFAPKGGVFNLQYSEELEFGDFLDIIYSVLHSIDTRIKAFKYDRQWYVMGADGQKITSPRSEENADSRPLRDVGIRQGQTLRVLPVSSDWPEK
jgi:hypothetical protein